jgi:succinate dehydrogenase flavin-adding protein (antitoxin of CptAB toxin-antitoxin module)
MLRRVARYCGNMILPENTAALKKAIEYRCKHVGMLEVEHVLVTWCNKHLADLSDLQMREFHNQVLETETVDLYRFFFDG